MTMHTRFGWLAFAIVLAIAPRIGEAQLAPMGTHYAGRASDTGFTGPNESGGYSATVPLDLPPARGGLPVPLQIVSGGARYGAAGVGWDIPLSYIYIDTSLVHRRPSNKPGVSAVGRKRITLSLLGRSVEMLPRANNTWIGRDAPDLELRQDGGAWTLFDGNGVSYLFTGDGNLAGVGGPWVGEHSLLLLSRITGRGGASVRLSYDIGLQKVSSTDVTPAATIDLVSIEYNPHPSGACFKTMVSLGYARHAAADAISILGTRVIARYSHLTSVAVQSRATCSSSPVTLRTYDFKYDLTDPDTRQDRLTSVTVRGREDKPEGSVPLPVAAFKYGSASTPSSAGEPTLTFAQQETVALPDAGGARDGFGLTEKMPSGFQSPYVSAPNVYAATQMLADMTGDGRADFVYRHKQTGQLMIARNVADGDGKVTFANPVPLADAVFTPKLLDIRTMQFDRFSEHADNDLNREYVWTQTIDVNGDGRLDVVDASAVPGYWIVYLNTPSNVPSGIAWVRREYYVKDIYDRLAGRGFHVSDGYLPLALRTTGHDYNTPLCWKQQNGTYVPHLVPPDPTWCPVVNPPPWTPLPPDPVQTTFTEWELKDMNGDGYPDFIANSDPVEFVLQPYGGLPPESPIPEKFLGLGRLRFEITMSTERPPTIDVAFNVVGVYFENATLPFSSFQELKSDYADTGRCGIATWSTWDASRHAQYVACDIEDVNGDGLPDRVTGRKAQLGNGVDFNTTTVSLPAELHRQYNPWLQSCSGHDTYYSFEEYGLRDLTGDGIPDQLVSGADTASLYPGTSSGIGQTLVRGSKGSSFQEEECHGAWSRTMGGLVDVDGDGRADSVQYNAGTPKTITISRLQGGTSPNNLDASRLVQIDNGYGASTRISYRSAKSDNATKHQVASPEIVVDKIETVDGVGRPLLAATRYAYGNIDTFFDAAADAFRPTGYLRRVEVVAGDLDAGGSPQAIATVTDLYDLEPVSTSSLPSLSPAQRYGRYLRVGQPKSTAVFSVRISTDPWALIATDLATAPQRISQIDYGTELTDTRVFKDVVDSGEMCVDMALPYHFNLSSTLVNPAAPFNPCTARGFLHTRTVGSWRGSEAPPSAASVQTFTQLLKEDDLGHPIKVFHQNDRTKGDDDYCVETTYVQPPDPASTTLGPRFLHATASRRITDCGIKNMVFAEESFDYDNLPNTIVTNGFLTAHTTYRHEADTGRWLSTIRDANIRYDANANPSTIDRVREDGAFRAVSFVYDEFALSPIITTTSGSGVRTLTTKAEIDPVTGEVTSTTDPNGTKTEIDYDAFGRPLSTTVPTTDGARRGVIETRQYVGFEAASRGRRVVTKQYADPVSPQDVALAEARTSTTFLDALGRTRQTVVDLGDDYAHQTLVLGDRTYDLLGRVDYEADPHPSNVRMESGYGTTRFWKADGSLLAEIRGPGKQLFTTTPDPQRELFPTLYEHDFANHLESVRVRAPDSLTPGSPQADVYRETLMTAIGRVVSRATWQGGTRIEFADMGHDPLGNVRYFQRYQSPGNASNAVIWKSRYDSLGQLIELEEPAVSKQTRTYSDFGELKATSWEPRPPYAERKIENDFDAYGRLTRSKETNDNVVDPATIVTYGYDDPHTSSLFTPTNLAGRLSYTTSPAGDMALSYDAFGNVSNRSYFDDARNEYSEAFDHHADGSISSLTLKLPDNEHRAERVSYEYDSAGRPSSMWFDDGVNTRDLYSAKTDLFGRVRDASFGIGNTSILHADYNDTGRRLPKRTSLTTPSGSRALNFVTFDALGREVERREELAGYEDKHVSSFDALGQLSGVQRYRNNVLADTSSFTYDALGNVRVLQGAGSVTTLSFDSADRDRVCGINYSLVPYPLCNVQYDNLGSITKMRTPGGTRTLSYFNSGAVRSISRLGTTAQFRYDAQGNIAKLDITNGATLLRSDRNFGPYMTARTQSGPFGLSSYTSRLFPGPGVTISRRGASGPWVYEFAEERGTRFTVDDNGQFKQDVAYSPFGMTTSTGVGAGDATFTTAQWNGGDALDGLGVVQVGARVYDPMLGRFLSRDPLMIPRGATTSNPYAFAWNDPINGSDPTGLDTCWGICGLAIGASTPGQSASPSSASSASSDLGVTGTVTFGIVYSLLKILHDGPATDQGFGRPQTSSGTPNPLMGYGQLLSSIASRAIAGPYGNTVTIGQAWGSWEQAQLLASHGIEHELRALDHDIRGGDWLRALWHVRGFTDEISGFFGPAFALRAPLPGQTYIQDGVEIAGGETTYVYRGVHAGHPALQDALQGRAVPGDINGTVTATDHNLGGVSDFSPYTSWTHDYETAVFHATKHGPGGVILRVPVGAPPPGATWSWEWSEDVYYEKEVLLRGVREGATVLRP